MTSQISRKVEGRGSPAGTWGRDETIKPHQCAALSLPRVPSPFHGLLSVFQRIAYTPAYEVDGCAEDSTLSKATEGRTSNCEQNGHREILLSLCLIGCDSMIEYQ